MAMFKLVFWILVSASVTEAADYLRHKSDSAAKALSLVEWCEDADERCSEWAKQGECVKNPTYMSKSCCKSCQSVKTGPLTSSEITHDHDSSKVKVAADIPHPHKHVERHSNFWGTKSYMYVAMAYIPYALMIVLIAVIWQCLGGRTPPGEVRSRRFGANTRHGDFEFGLFDPEQICNHHMWICVCAFCCSPIRMADTYSKEGYGYATNRAIIPGFWVALGVTLLMGLFVDLTCGLGMLLFVGMAVYFRQKIRQAYGLPRGWGTVAWDCLYWCCCPWCTAAQEARQIECATNKSTGAVATLPGSGNYVTAPASGNYVTAPASGIYPTVGSGSFVNAPISTGRLSPSLSPAVPRSSSPRRVF